MNPFEGMGRLTRNPLGIIAVFLGILYGIAGLLLGADARPLTELNQTILTLLVFIFPFVSLGVFAWLVSKHHAKLYSPHDYRTDEGFFGSIQIPTAAESLQKLNYETVAAELETAAAESELPETGDTEGGNPAATPDFPPHGDDAPRPEEFVVSPVRVAGVHERRNQLQFAETLVLNKLGREFEKFIGGVKLTTKSGRSILFDAAGRKGDDYYVIEVICLHHYRNLNLRVRDVVSNVISLMNPEQVRLLICVVWLEGTPSQSGSALDSAKNVLVDLDFSRAEFRIYDFLTLKQEVNSTVQAQD